MWSRGILSGGARKRNRKPGTFLRTFYRHSGNPNNVIQATRFVALNANLVDVFFNFGTANAGKTFLIFVSGPNGTLSSSTQTCPTTPGGPQPNIQVTFKCDNPPPPGGPIDVPPDIAIISGCDLSRTDAGGFVLTVTGANIAPDSTIKIGATEVTKKKYKAPDANGRFAKVILKGQALCALLPGPITIKNSPTGVVSVPFQCNRTCPSQN